MATINNYEVPTAEDIMEDRRKEQEMIAMVEEVEKKFREACNDMIANMHSLKRLQEIVDEEWNNFRYLKNEEK